MENRQSLIAKYNQLSGTRCKSFREIYWREPSSKIARKLKISSDSIRNWVRDEGGSIKPVGGNRGLNFCLKDLLQNITPEALAEMTQADIAELTGYDQSWCSVVLNSLGIKYRKLRRR